MELKTLLFYAFSGILVLAALRVVTARNPVHAVMFLVLSFFTAASLWMLLGAEFLAIVLVLVYIGAVMVLFLFVVMMLDIDLSKLREGFRKNLLVAIPIGIIVAAEMGIVLMRGFWDKKLGTAAGVVPVGSTRELGIALFTEYVYAFEVAAAILLVAMVAAVALTLSPASGCHVHRPGQGRESEARRSRAAGEYAGLKSRTNRSLTGRARHDDLVTGALPDSGRGAVRHCDLRHFCQSQEHPDSADVD